MLSDAGSSIASALPQSFLQQAFRDTLKKGNGGEGLIEMLIQYLNRLRSSQSTDGHIADIIPKSIDAKSLEIMSTFTRTVESMVHLTDV
jgi:hypothetical protein